MKRGVGVGVIGYGTIGAGVVRLLRQRAKAHEDRLGYPVRLARVADLDTSSDRGIKLPKGVLIDDARALIDDPSVNVVVELVGGVEPARTFILEALRAGKHVVTANKALLSEHGVALSREAAKRGLLLGFEASVGGGIPIVRTIKESLAGDTNEEVYGILNGTANYILSAMSDGEGEFDEVLARAQAMGLAEADPSYDVDGIDSVHKLVILVGLAFGKKIKARSVHVEGIRSVSSKEIAYAREFGYRVKLLAVARDTPAGVEARVHPAMVPESHLLAQVSGAYNAVCIKGRALGNSVYYGQGAGMMPTATAVLGDVLEAARSLRDERPPSSEPWGQPLARLSSARVIPMGDTAHEHYLRLTVVDKPGALARISSILADEGIGIATLSQHEIETRGAVPVVLRTHRSAESAMKRALARVGRLRDNRAKPVLLRVEEGLGGRE
ncbi:MAG TPA: homoserine dehydrogenase [Deltaproteobacteria bacterium]|nr:homoserine dehydrogenase [Deltaproteobacteria bacterium]